MVTSFKRPSCRSSSPSSRAITRQRVAKSGSLKSSTDQVTSSKDLFLEDCQRRLSRPVVAGLRQIGAWDDPRGADFRAQIGGERGQQCARKPRTDTLRSLWEVGGYRV